DEVVAAADRIGLPDVVDHDRELVRVLRAVVVAVEVFRGGQAILDLTGESRRVLAAVEIELAIRADVEQVVLDRQVVSGLEAVDLVADPDVRAVGGAQIAALDVHPHRLRRPDDLLVGLGGYALVVDVDLGALHAVEPDVAPTAVGLTAR